MLSERATVLVGGLASPGKAQLVAALHRQFARQAVTVRTITILPSDSVAVALYVQAESDAAALVETPLARHGPPPVPDLVIQVDWEPLEQSVGRVVETLIARGLLAPLEAA
jgi:hypothetical protein